MRCIECLKPIRSISEIESREAVNVSLFAKVHDGRYPTYSVHAKCAGGKRLISVCGGHVTPPDLEQIERRIK